MNENRLNKLLENLLEDYPDAKGVSFHSMESPVELFVGEQQSVLEKYKDIPMISIDEEFQTSFSYIITEKGSIVIFFINDVHFISVFVDTQDPNKQLAMRIYGQYKIQFENII